MTLGEFLAGRTGSPGDWNCSTLAADWCVELGHRDFAAAWRGVVGEDACAEAHIEPGDLVVLWNNGIGDALPAVRELAAGDIAILERSGHEAGAIFTGTRWAIQGTRGLHFLAPDHARVLKAWRPAMSKEPEHEG